jgi:hypothetical protein
MAWTTPTNVATGDVLTASRYNNEVVANALAGGPVYATLADLNTAIPSPFEGQRAYLTAPAVGTVTAAGTVTYVPTGIDVRHNGTGWVCLTPVGAFSAAGGTATGAWTPTLSGSPGTNPSVTILTGATALVTIKCNIQFAATQTIEVDVAVSGATTINAGTVARQGIYQQSSILLENQYTATFILSGLTAGVNVFTLNYQNNVTASTYTQRRLTVQGIA